MTFLQVFKQTTNKALELLLLFLRKSRSDGSCDRHGGSGRTERNSSVQLWRLWDFCKSVGTWDKTDLDENVASHF
jgi:hypothetical protein